MTVADSIFETVSEAVRSPFFLRAHFGGPRRGGPESPILRAKLRRLDDRLHLETFTQKQSFSKTLTDTTRDAALRELCELQFSAVHLFRQDEECELRLSRKGKLLKSRRTAPKQPVSATKPGHNRVKTAAFREGEPNRFLELLGIMDARGRVRPALRAKFTQINEFLKQFGHILGDSGLLSLGRPVEILDAGCGSSHLTLAVHDYLHNVLGVPANVLGVDVNDDVIRSSLARADVLDAAGVQFACARIDAVTVKPDVVISLHACDIATDAALAAAIKAEAKLILSVPCCHHHLNEQLKAANVEVLRPILRHGILHERQSDIITDALRALLLRMHGYTAEVVEFISPEHTARNLMIRAVKSSDRGPEQYFAEYEAMKAFWGVTPYLENALSEISNTPAS